jgi:L-fucono-1,5-lactonase
MTVQPSKNVHFYAYDPLEHPWVTEELSELRGNYSPADLLPLMSGAGFDGCVAVEARQSVEENAYLLDLLGRYEQIRAVVGWVDLCDPAVGDELDRWADRAGFAGVRHVLIDEPDDGYLLRPDFQRGIRMLASRGLLYELLVAPRHLEFTAQLVAAHPDQPFVVDHLALPEVRGNVLQPWADRLRALASFENVSCKLSGLDLMAAWHAWEPAQFVPFLDVALQAFGPDRLMVASNWPVCTVSGSYAEVTGAVQSWVSRMPERDRDAILGEACARIYRILGRSVPAADTAGPAP